MNNSKPEDCQACDWISIEDVLQQQNEAPSAVVTHVAQPAAPEMDTVSPAGRSLTQRFTGLFKAKTETV